MEISVMRDSTNPKKLVNNNNQAELKVYRDGGMTSMRSGRGRLLFRHSPLGLGNTCGHGHADALSIIFNWNNVPVLIDLGSGQYNGNQSIRNYFRSTIAHNTIEIGEIDQAKMLGPFLWDKSYRAWLNEAAKSPVLYADATHDGYRDSLSVLHTRRIEWPSTHIIVITDTLESNEKHNFRGAFHLGQCRTTRQMGQTIQVDFNDFAVLFSFPPEVVIRSYYGSEAPFIGWRSLTYGAWDPIHTIIYSGTIQGTSINKISLEVLEKNNYSPK